MATSKHKPSFDEFGFEEEGKIFWWASWYATILGYSSLKTFMASISKAIQACSTLDINISENFLDTRRKIDGKSRRDFKLSRFACYMIAMNADGRKPVVARAQVYFAEQVEKINLILEGSKDIERLLTREEIKEGHQLLTAAAGRSGVKDFRFFMNEGYIGMYNKPIREVKVAKGIGENQNLYDYMGRMELAANLFRITLTEERLKKKGTNSAYEAAEVHKHVGESVRKMVKDHTGNFPEELPLERRLSEVSSELKKANKLLNEKKE